MENHTNQNQMADQRMGQKVDESLAGNGGGESAADVIQLIEEAEERGYIRGRNEAAEQLIGKPALFEEVHQRCAPVQASPLLTPRRVSIWDLP